MTFEPYRLIMKIDMRDNIRLFVEKSAKNALDEVIWFPVPAESPKPAEFSAWPESLLTVLLLEALSNAEKDAEETRSLMRRTSGASPSASILDRL